MSDVQVDSVTFRKRVHLLQKKIANGDSGFNGATSLLVVTGKDQESPYMKSAILHSWLIGYEFPSTGLLVTKDKVVFVTSASKAKHLAGLAKDESVKILSRTKDPEHNKQLFQEFIDEIKSAGEPAGVFEKDKHEGAFFQEWQEASKDMDIKKVDVAGGVAQTLQIKDEEELRAIRAAAKVSDKCIKYFADQMSRYIDMEKKITHNKFSNQVEGKIGDDKWLNALKISNTFDPDQVDWCYNPIIQSGGNFDLRPSATPDDNNLTAGIILCQLGIRYKSYCSNVGRTYLIDPTKRQEGHYNFLVSLQKKVIDMIKEGAVAKDIYNAALDIVKDKAPDLQSHFLKNIGTSIGIDFRDTTCILNAKQNAVLKDGMTLNVTVGFQDIPNPEGKGKNASYSLVLSDTVRVGSDNAIVFTDSDKSFSSISYFFKDDDVAETQTTKKERAPSGKGAILKTRLRGENKAQEDTDREKRRQMHQKELHERLQKRGKERFAGTSGNLDGEDKAVFKKYESYKRDNQFPPSIKDLRIHVDTRAQTIIIPINGRPVPFHINSFKNGSKNDEGEYVYLRLNFHSPGQGSTKKDEVPFEDPEAQFLKNITIRSRDTDRMNDIFKRITDLKKEALKRENERKEMADVVEQGSLVEQRQRRPLRLDSVFVRPGLEGKRMAGALEVHQNGVRYIAPGGTDSRIEVLFSNVKHLFFQPCDQELIVIIHMHLKNPIIVGKRKTYDVQFYREASDMAVDETGNKKRRYRYGDEDELEQEQEERRRRAQLNKEFKNFAEKISEASGNKFDLDVPIRELGFYGVPQRSNVLLQPTTDCLIQLTDPPFLVITLNEIEVCHFERIAFGLKQFDLVFVYKDFRKPTVSIKSVPMDQLDAVKDWLNELDMPYFEGPINLNWATIMKTVNDDPHDFFENGGWSFLDLEDDEDGGEESEPESEFNPSDDNPSDEEGSEEEDEYGEDESDSEGSYEDESDDGEDWDELESKAAKSDAKKEGGGGDGGAGGSAQKRKR